MAKKAEKLKTFFTELADEKEAILQNLLSRAPAADAGLHPERIKWSRRPSWRPGKPLQAWT